MCVARLFMKCVRIPTAVRAVLHYYLVPRFPLSLWCDAPKCYHISVRMTYSLPFFFFAFLYFSQPRRS